MNTSQDDLDEFAAADVSGGGRLAAGVALAGGRYQIVGMIGRGAFGEVYRATEKAAGQPVAIRLISPDLLQGQNAAERLRSELAIAARLDHKNIAKTLDFDTEQDLVYVVTEFVDGQTLRALLQRKRAAGSAAFSLKGAYNVIAHVLNALTFAHKGTLHGALSASNILVNKAGRVKLTEFGLARALPAFSRMASQAPEDLAAMAPEFASAPSKADRRADIYSVGAVLYELLTGRPPSESLARPSSVVAGLPPEVDQVIARCLAPSPNDRFVDASELKNVLHNIVEAKGAAAAGAPSLPPQPRPSLPQAAQPAPPAAKPRVSAPQPRMSAAQSAQGISIDESEEKWLIQRNKLDFGPFNFAQIKEQIRTDQIVPGNVIIDNENGARCAVEAHPLLHDLVGAAAQRRDDNRRANAEMTVVKSDKRKGLALYAMIGLGVVALGTGGYFVVKAVKGSEKKQAAGDIESLEDTQLQVAIQFKPKATRATPAKTGGTRRPGGGGTAAGGADPGFDDSIDLGDASEGGGSERLDANTQINPLVQANGGRLVSCMRKNGERSAEIELIIRGNGRVSDVRVNGSTSTGLARCIKGVLSSIQFDTFNGPRTKATFDISF